MNKEESFCAVKHPMEPSLPAVGSDDEESFVVLGTSSFNEEDVEGSLNDEVLPPIRTNKVHDMQNLIKMELSQINNSTTLPEMPSAADTLNAVTSSVANITLSPDSSYEEIQKQVEELIKENEKLKNIIAQNNLSMKTHYERILTWKEGVNEVVRSHRSKIFEAKNYIDKCKEEISRLTNDVEKYKKIKELQDEEIMNLKRKEKEKENVDVVCSSAEQNMIQFDLQVAKKKVEDLQTELAETNIKKAELMAENEKLTQKLVSTTNIEEQLEMKNTECQNLQLENKMNNEQIIKLKNENDKLKSLLELEQQKNKLAESSVTSTVYENKIKSSDAKIHQLEQHNYSLTEEIATLKAQALKVQSFQETLQEKFDQQRVQLMHSQETITALEEDVKSKVQEIEKLRDMLQQSNAKSDEFYALKEQLTVFKNDFEAERESKNAIKRERDQIAEDLQNLQKRNKQLQNEVENLRARTEPPKPEGYHCPKCNFGFNNYQSLENHVHRCLDLEGFP